LEGARTLEAVRKAALSEKRVMHDYAQELRARAERAESGAGPAGTSEEYADAIRQRDEVHRLFLEHDESLRAARERLASLEAEYADVIRQRDQVHQYLIESERGTERLSQALSETTGQLAQQRSEVERVAGELAALTVRHESLHATFADVERRFVLQTERLVASIQSENAQLTTLIDTVQSSHFWKLKNWLSRLLGRR
jgi:predicted nuclease with TOPRIM domain